MRAGIATLVLSLATGGSGAGTPAKSAETSRAELAPVSRQADAPGAVVRLPSGKKVRVYSVTRVAFGDNSHPPSFMLRYETELEPKDSEGLRSEVREVWELLRPKCDVAGDSYAMIMANEPIRGVVSQTRSFTYGFEKGVDGQWRMREPKKAPGK